MVPIYPICLHLSNKPVLVVGGGQVATARVRNLLEAGAQVTLVSPEVTPDLEDLVAKKAIHHHPRPVEESDVAAQAMVLACTDDPKVNACVATWARQRGAWVNRADALEESDFSLPSVGRRGEIVIAISTSGQSPGLASHLRHRLEAQLDGADESALVLLADIRNQLMQDRTLTVEKRAEIMRLLISMDLASTIRNGGLNAAKNEIKRVLRTD